MARKDLPVLILGGGSWGLSTTLYMLNSGYTDITVIERAEQVPSRYSAAWDLNKIVRAEYEDAFYTGLALVSSSFSLDESVPNTCNSFRLLLSQQMPPF